MCNVCGSPLALGWWCSSCKLTSGQSRRLARLRTSDTHKALIGLALAVLAFWFLVSLL